MVNFLERLKRYALLYLIGRKQEWEEDDEVTYFTVSSVGESSFVALFSGESQVDWGDGTVEEITSGVPISHVFENVPCVSTITTSPRSMTSLKIDGGSVSEIDVSQNTQLRWLRVPPKTTDHADR